jgi:hypothetical protein
MILFACCHGKLSGSFVSQPIWTKISGNSSYDQNAERWGFTLNNKNENSKQWPVLPIPFYGAFVHTNKIPMYISEQKRMRRWR